MYNFIQASRVSSSSANLDATSCKLRGCYVIMLLAVQELNSNTSGRRVSCCQTVWVVLSEKGKRQAGGVYTYIIRVSGAFFFPVSNLDDSSSYHYEQCVKQNIDNKFRRPH